MNAEPTDDLRSFLAVLSCPGDVREVRIPTSRRTDSGYFDDPVALAAAVRPYDGRENVYITVNPVDPALLARAANRIKQGRARRHPTETSSRAAGCRSTSTPASVRHLRERSGAGGGARRHARRLGVPPRARLVRARDAR